MMSKAFRLLRIAPSDEGVLGVGPGSYGVVDAFMSFPVPGRGIHIV